MPSTKSTVLSKSKPPLCACGCGEKMNLSARGGWFTYRQYIRGHGNVRHGMYGTREYRSWQSMKQRCFNENAISYPHYGARGITVCDRWLDFINFYEDMGPRPEGMSLHRIDNNGDYEPGNVRWATSSEQRANQR